MDSAANKRVLIVDNGSAEAKERIKEFLSQQAEVYIVSLTPQPSEWKGHLHYWQGDCSTLSDAEWLAFNSNHLYQFPSEESVPISHSYPERAVLITSISNKVPLISSVKNALKRLRLPWKTIGCDANPSALGQYHLDQFWVSPPLEHLSVDELLAYCKEHAISAVIPTRDADLIFYAQHKQLLKEAGIAVMVSEPATVNLCLDKLAFANFLKEQKFPFIPTAESIDPLEAEEFVVKERYGAGSRLIGLKLNREQAVEHSRQLKHPIFQPWIEGKEWTVDLFCSQTRHLQGVIARSRDFVVHGESQLTTTQRNPSLEQLCSSIATSLNITGHALFQVLEDASGKFWVVECNARFGGASTASLSAGLDSFRWFFLEALGESLEDSPFLRIPGEIRQVRSPHDLIIPWKEQVSR